MFGMQKLPGSTKERDMKQLLVVLAIVLLALPAASQEKRIAVPLDNSPAFGPADAPVMIVEFIDFQ